MGHLQGLNVIYTELTESDSKISSDYFFEQIFDTY